MEATPDDLHPQNTLDEFTPLTKGNYPVFNKFPKFIVDYQVRGFECLFYSCMHWFLNIDHIYERKNSFQLGS